MKHWFLAAIYFIFTLFSTLTLSSIAPQLAARQLTSFILGGILFFVASRISVRWIQQIRWILYAGGIILLMIPLVLFSATRGTHRWIDIAGIFTIQSSQFALPATIFAALTILTQAKSFGWLLLGKFLLTIGIPAGLILIAPDLGSTIAFALPPLMVLPLLPFSNKKIVTLLVVGIIGSFLAWHFVLEEYQKIRFMAFLQPESADNYNAHQALITIGSGKFLGRGLGQGIQSHLQFLPERQTDFIFASFAEEYGFFGCLVLIGMYAVLCIFLYIQARALPNTTEKLFLLVVFSTIFLQTTINIYMNLGLLPITGITLPFMSYGGSSILGLAILLGICQATISRAPQKSALHIG
ncbi:FtsW/RodA/SpoVE family cell cycle protein [Candidatus Woesebacteria bacterium]|nr:FtsW/RodA/SpoVE family cell cycle protein [Candidatus Woesebacteria bacterium]